MNEEEKKAICELKNYISRRKLKYTKLDRHDKSIDNLLNLIEKLQKENEYYKECLEVVSKHLYNIDYDQILFAIYEYYISKQKVKDKIEELKAQYKTALEENTTEAFILMCQITILKELIEEREEK